jgi:hypothetical protein
VQPSSKWLEAAAIIQKEPNKNFLVFHEFIADKAYFAAYLKTRADCTQGKISGES